MNNEFCVPLGELVRQIANNMSVADLSKSVVLMELSDTIAKKRKKMQMNQNDFAAYMGVSQGMVSKWESGEYNFTINTLSELAEKLDLKFVNPLVDVENESEMDQEYTFDNTLNSKSIIKLYDVFSPKTMSRISCLEGVAS